MIIRKTDLELLKMRQSGLLVHDILRACAEMVAEGVSTWDLEVVAEKMIRMPEPSPPSRDITFPRRE